MNNVTAPICARTGCDAHAGGLLAFEIRPVKEVLEMHQTDAYITRILAGLNICAAHAAEVKAAEFLGPALEKVASAIETATNLPIDREFRSVMVAYDDPEVGLFNQQLAQRAPKMEV